MTGVSLSGVSLSLSLSRHFTVIHSCKTSSPVGLPTPPSPVTRSLETRESWPPLACRHRQDSSPSLSSLHPPPPPPPPIPLFKRRALQVVLPDPSHLSESLIVATYYPSHLRLKLPAPSLSLMEWSFIRVTSPSRSSESLFRVALPSHSFESLRRVTPPRRSAESPPARFASSPQAC